MYSLAELRPGMTIQIDGTPYVVLSSQHSKMGRAAGVAKTTIKNLITGSIIPKTFQGNDKIEPADVYYSKAQYLYSDKENCFFMDATTFEQFTIAKKMLGEKIPYLLEGTDVDIQNFQDRPISIKLPPKVNLAIKETEPGVRGNTAQGGSKPAILETGLKIQVPLFININDTVRINTETGEYVERA